MNMCSYNCCKISKNEAGLIRNLSKILKIMGDESRLKILCILKKGELCVCEIENNLDLSQSLISHHLADLKEAELIIDRKDRRWVYYSLTSKGKDIINKIFSLKGE